MFKIITNSNYTQERQYVADVVFKEFLGLDFILEFRELSGILLVEYNNTQVSFPDIFFSTAESSWLNPDSFPDAPIPVLSFNYEGLYRKQIPALYCNTKVPGKYSCDLDILGSIFFLLTRYEEVSAPLDDPFGRYDFRNSILYKENLMDRPLANEYLDLLKVFLKELNPSIKFKKHEYKLCLSHDVDVPVTFSAGWVDCLKKAAGDLLHRRSILLCGKRLFGKVIHSFNGSLKYDPNNNLSFLMDAAGTSGIKSTFNFIPKPGKEIVDSTYELRDRHIIIQLQNIYNRGFEVGLHPSFQTYNDFKQAFSELQMLNDVLLELGIPPARIGRQHYLRWSNPTSWQIWNDLGLEVDCSLGYDGVNGFRSGCCYEYSVFNLITRKHLKLKEQPLIVMDNNSSIHNSYRINEDASKFSSIIKFFNGQFSLLIHNNYILSREQKMNYMKLLSENT